METNIDPRLQEDESTMRPIEELTEIQMDPNKPSHVVKNGKGLKRRASAIVHGVSIPQPRRVCIHTCRHGGDSPQSYVPPVEHRAACEER